MINGSKNDFTVAFVGCLRKKDVAFEDAMQNNILS